MWAGHVAEVIFKLYAHDHNRASQPALQGLSEANLKPPQEEKPAPMRERIQHRISTAAERQKMAMKQNETEILRGPSTAGRS